MSLQNGINTSLGVVCGFEYDGEVLFGFINGEKVDLTLHVGKISFWIDPAPRFPMAFAENDALGLTD